MRTPEHVCVHAVVNALILVCYTFGFACVEVCACTHVSVQNVPLPNRWLVCYWSQLVLAESW